MEKQLYKHVYIYLW